MKSLEGRSENKGSFDIGKEFNELMEDVTKFIKNEPHPKPSNVNERNKLAQKSSGWTRNREVALAQASLKVAGYEIGPYGVDGRTGNDTGKAVKQFQAALGLKITGELDSKTMMALEKVTEAGLNGQDVMMCGRARNERMNLQNPEKKSLLPEIKKTKENRDKWSKGTDKNETDKNQKRFETDPIEKVKILYKHFESKNPNIEKITAQTVKTFAETNSLNEVEKLYLCLMIAHYNLNFLAGFKGIPTVDWLKNFAAKSPTWCNAYAAYALYLFSGNKELMNEKADPTKMGNFRDPTKGWTLTVPGQLEVIKSKWTKITAIEAQEYANHGKFAVGIAIIPKVDSKGNHYSDEHIAVVAPGEHKTVNGVFYPAVGQEGGFSTKYNEYNDLLQGITGRGTMDYSWTSTDFNKVEFYVKL